MKDTTSKPHVESIEDLVDRYIRRREMIGKSNPSKLDAFREAVRRQRTRTGVFRSRMPRDTNVTMPQRRSGRRWWWRGVVFVAACVAAKLMAPAEVDRGLAWTLRQLSVDPAQVAELHRQVQCANRDVVVDAAGQFLMLRPLDVQCRVVSTGYVGTSVPDEAALTLALAVESIEGSSLVSRRNLLGVLDFAVIKRVGEYFAARVTGADGLRRMTGTPPLLSAIEVAMNRPGALGGWEKLKTLALGAMYSAHHLEGNGARARFMAENLPCVRGASRSRFGKPIAGALCAEALFGRTPTEATDPARACLWAGAAGFPVRYWTDDTPDGAREQARQAEERVRVRARNCLRRLLPDGAKYSEALESIAAWEPQATIRRFVKRRAGHGLSIIMVDALAGRTARAPIHLALDAETQIDAGTQLRHALEALDPLLPKNLCSRTECDAPDVGMIVAELVGDRLLARVIYGNRHGTLFPVTGTEPAIFRSLGSVSKMPTTLLSQPGTLLCDRAIGGIQNVGGGKGHARCIGKALIPATEAFDQSLNLPLIDLALKNKDHAHEIYRAAGYKLSGSFPTAAVLGFGATASLARHMAVLAAMDAGAEGRAPFVRGLEFLHSQPVEAVDLSGLGLPAPRYQHARSLLAGVGGAGTLAGLNARLKKFGCDRAFSKSGTAETQADATGVKTRALVALTKCGARTFVIGLFVGSPGGVDRDIGRIPSPALIEIAMAAAEPVLARALSTD